MDDLLIKHLWRKISSVIPNRSDDMWIKDKYVFTACFNGRYIHGDYSMTFYIEETYNGLLLEVGHPDRKTKIYPLDELKYPKRNRYRDKQ